jgi:hypothetical protein
MKSRPFSTFLAASMLLLGVACRPAPAPEQSAAPQEASVSETARLEKMTGRFAPVDIVADLSALPAQERQALAKVIEAARLTDALFLRQVWAGNQSMLMEMVKDETPLGRARLHYYLINKGPWSRLDHNESFVPGAPEKPEAANFYPAGATNEEVQAWLMTLKEPERQSATGFFTTLRRPPAGKAGTFLVVPYSLEYQGELARMAELLREAAGLTSQPTLKKFLAARADALLTNDYYSSDVAWMELDSSIEPTIGPYEVYEDEWLNAKAAFEAFIAVRDDAETAKLAKLGASLQDIEDNLPIDARHRNPRLGGLAPIRVVNEIFAAGDGNHAVQTAAYNLPNDERVVKEKGAKRVMLRNVQQAKFDVALVPISKVVLSPADQKDVSFDAFFTHTVMHELMHGLGPHQISVAGRATTVRQELKEIYSAIEEAKADISGLFALQRLVDRGVLDKSLEKTMYKTFLASAFRSIRFGVNEAHGRGTAIQLNYLTDYGAFTMTPDGIFAVNPAKVREGVNALTRDIMTYQAQGNYERAKAMAARLGVVRPEIQRVLDRLRDVPVDIEPRFKTAEELSTAGK